MNNDIVQGVADAPVDDLTESLCARCGTEYNLHRPISLFLDGEFHGEVICEDCLTDEEADILLHGIGGSS